MHFSTVSVLATLLSLATAYPQSPDQGTTEIPPVPPNVNQLRANNRIQQVAAGTQVPGPEAYASAFAKYKKTPVAANINVAAKKTTATSAGATATKQSTSVQATPGPNDISYSVNMTVGKTKMILNLDTGSSDFWVFSSKLTQAERGTHNIYKLGGTKVPGATWDISYGDGTGASGIVYMDKAQIGGVVAQNISIEAATDLSSRFTTGYQDGIVGLGFPDGNTCFPRCTPFLAAIAPNLTSPIVTFALRKAAPGDVTFGYIDPGLFTGAVTYAPTNDNLGGGYWEFNSGGYSLNNGSKITRKMDTIADTGTSLLLADDAVVSDFYAALPTAYYDSTYGAMCFACNETDLLPDLSYYIGGSKHTMPGSYGVYGQISTPAGYCYGGVQSNNGMGFTILGDVFLKSQYVVFDYGRKRIGFAQQAGVVF